VLGGKIYVFGGRTRFAGGGEGPGTPKSVEVFDPAANAWTKMMAEMPTGRRTAVVAVLNGKAFVFGGEDDGQVFAAAEEFDPANASEPWRKLSPMPTPRHGAAGGAIGSTIYVVGGSTAPGIAATAVNEAFSPGDETQPPPDLPNKLFLPLIMRQN
jgi:N-acetylneuraminic acid mutarotase